MQSEISDVGDYFACSTKIKDLVREGSFVDAEVLFYGSFISALFPGFIQQQLNEYGKWAISTVEGWEAFINYLAMGGKYQEVESLIHDLAARFPNTSFQKWIKDPLPSIRKLESKISALIARLANGEEIIQANYYSEQPEDGYFVIKSAIQQGLVEKQRYKRSYRIMLRK